MIFSIFSSLQELLSVLTENGTAGLWLPKDISLDTLKEYNKLVKDVNKTEQDRITFLNSCTEAEKNLIQANGKGAIELEKYTVKAHLATLKTKALAAAKKLLDAALTAGVVWLLTEAVMGLVKAFDDWHESSEEIQEAAENAKDSINKLKSSYEDLSTAVTDIKDRYAELAQGVDSLTGKNLSLNSEDYKEFLSLSNQLAELFPTLSRNYDDNGNAIVQLTCTII